MRLRLFEVPDNWDDLTDDERDAWLVDVLGAFHPDVRESDADGYARGGVS